MYVSPKSLEKLNGSKAIRNGHITLHSTFKAQREAVNNYVLT